MSCQPWTPPRPFITYGLLSWAHGRFPELTVGALVTLCRDRAVKGQPLTKKGEQQWTHQYHHTNSMPSSLRLPHQVPSIFSPLLSRKILNKKCTSCIYFLHCSLLLHPLHTGFHSQNATEVVLAKITNDLPLENQMVFRHHPV